MALSDRDEHICRVAAVTLERVSQRLETAPALRRTQQVAWGALTDSQEFVRQQAYQILANATQRLDLLLGQQLPIRDIVLARPRLAWRQWVGHGLLALILLILVTFLTIDQNLLSNRLDSYIFYSPANLISLVVLVLLLPLIILILTLLLHTKNKSNN